MVSKPNISLRGGDTPQHEPGFIAVLGNVTLNIKQSWFNYQVFRRLRTHDHINVDQLRFLFLSYYQNLKAGDNYCKLKSMKYETIVICLFTAGAAACWFLALLENLKRCLHFLQLDDYLPLRMLNASRRTWLRSLLLPELPILIIVYVAVKWNFIRLENAVVMSMIIILFGASFITRWRTTRKKIRAAKKPLVLTSRARRILGTALFVSSALLLVLIRLLTPQDYSYPGQWLFPVFAAAYLALVVSPLVITFSVALLHPLEKAIQNRYLKQAKQILAEFEPVVIGITGSYGKTGTKELLSAMLAEKYNVFKPPGSYNTLMGVTRIIRERLRHYHEIFVAEMGAYRIGSIAKLCRLLQPQHGIITVIGVQHLERFKSQDNIRIAKGELIHALPKTGTAVLNGDDPGCRRIGADFKGDLVYFTLDPESGQALGGAKKVSVSNLRINPSGSDFRLTFHDDSTVDIHLPLLGRGAVANAAAAAAMAYRLGVPAEAIKRSLTGIPQVRHRLEAVNGEAGVRIIDDAFNSNPVGAAQALEVLKLSVGGKRILVTPGMVELGGIEDESNHNFGRQAADACDLVVLVGVRRIESIRTGLIDGGFPADKIWTVPTLQAGLEKLKSYTEPGDTILLENDLPDHYDNT